MVTTVSEVCAALGLKLPKEATSFYSTSASKPSFGEVALVAIVLLHSLERDALDGWVKLVSEQDSQYGVDGSTWTAPRSGAWARPRGELNATVASIVISAEKAAECAQALLKFGAVHAAPPIGSVTKYFSLLTSGSALEMQRGSRTVGRAPSVYLLSSRLLRRQRGRLQAALGAPVTRESRRVASRTELPPERLPYHAKEFDDSARRLNALKRDYEVSLQASSNHPLNHLPHVPHTTSCPPLSMAFACSQEAKLKARREGSQRKAAERELEATDHKLKASKQMLVDVVQKEEQVVCETVASNEAMHAREIAELEAEHAKELTQLDEQIARAAGEAERLRVRCSRGHTAELEAELAEKAAKVTELSARRANNMGAVKQLNLERRRNDELNRINKELRETIDANWGKETLALVEQALELPRLQSEIKVLKDALAEAETEIKSLKSVAFPPPPTS